MKKTQTMTELQSLRAVSNALFRFVQRFPPKGFPSIYFQILGLSGRMDEIPEFLDKWDISNLEAWVDLDPIE
jgi:hypothetical protein